MNRYKEMVFDILDLEKEAQQVGDLYGDLDLLTIEESDYIVYLNEQIDDIDEYLGFDYISNASRGLEDDR